MTPDALAALHARAFATPRPWSAGEFAGLLADPTVFLLAEGAVDGLLLGRVVAGEGELLTLAVDPDLRRQGIGRRLMVRFLSQAQALGAESLFLEVAADNRAAIALYQTSGFVSAGRRRGYYLRDGAAAMDALVMVRKGSDHGMTIS